MSFIVCYSCKAPSDSSSDGALARVYDTYLYASDLSGVVPPGALKNDSIQIVQTYIQNWIQQQLLLNKAKQNLGDEESKFEKQIEEYKNSLLIFSYQNKVSQQLLDTVVSDLDIAAYYENHTDLFYLKSNIVQVRFVKILKNHKNAEKIKKDLFADNLENTALVRLSRLCSSSAENYFLDDDKWLYFNELLKEIPIQTYNQEEFLNNNQKLEIVSGNYVYYVIFKDFKTKENISPLSFETKKIRTIILNVRKQKLLDNMRKDILKEAKQAREIEIY
ncbi:MAG: hypothetical protein RRY15_02010 [Bacteroidales bacterium]